MQKVCILLVFIAYVYHNELLKNLQEHITSAKTW
jgi:hypothetical protein